MSSGQKTALFPLRFFTAGVVIGTVLGTFSPLPPVLTASLSPHPPALYKALFLSLIPIFLVSFLVNSTPDRRAVWTAAIFRGCAISWCLCLLFRAFQYDLALTLLVSDLFLLPAFFLFVDEVCPMQLLPSLLQQHRVSHLSFSAVFQFLLLWLTGSYLRCLIPMLSTHFL